MRSSLEIIFFLLIAIVPAMISGQFSNTGFYDRNQETDICKKINSFSSDQEVIELIDRMVEKLGLENTFHIKACSQIDNCQAVVHNSKRYILYNKSFIESVKSLNFSETSIKKNSDENWQALTVLAHELGHHLNFHMDGSHPDKTSRELELEADRFAGRMMARLGASLEQAQSIFLTDAVSEEGSYEHPPRAQRLEAVKQGWQKGSKVASNFFSIDESEVFELGQPHLNVWNTILQEGELVFGEESTVSITQPMTLVSEMN